MTDSCNICTCKSDQWPLLLTMQLCVTACFSSVVIDTVSSCNTEQGVLKEKKVLFSH